MDVVVPKLGLTITEAEIGAWLRAVGDEVVAGDPLVEIRADKADVELDAPTSGVLASVHAAEGDVVPVGATIAVIAAGSNPPADVDRGPIASTEPATSERPAAPEGPPAVRADRPPAATGGVTRRPASSPRARARAAAGGQALTAIRGTGPGGRIVERDVVRTQAETGAPNRPAPDRPSPVAAAVVPAGPPAPGWSEQGWSEQTNLTWGVRDVRIDVDALDVTAQDWTAALVWAAAHVARPTGFAASAPGALTVRVETGSGTRSVTVRAADHLTREAVRARLVAPAEVVDDEPDLVVVDLRATGLHDGLPGQPCSTPTVVAGAPRATVGALRSGRSWTFGVEAALIVRAHPATPDATARMQAFLDAFSTSLSQATSLSRTT